MQRVLGPGSWAAFGLFALGCSGTVISGTENAGASGVVQNTGGTIQGSGGTGGAGVPSGGTGGTGASGNVEVFSWWTAGGEAQGFNAMVQLHRQRYPNVTVTNAALVDPAFARQALQDRLSSGDPPDLFQAGIGVDLMQYTGSAPRIESLSLLQSSHGWNVYPDLLQPNNASGTDGNLYGLPVDIHRINTLFVNLPILQRNGVDPASLDTLDGLHAALATLSTDTRLIAPISLGAEYQWTLDTTILQSILPAVAGGPFYDDYIHGRAQPDDPRITAMLDEAGALWQYMPKGTDAPTSIDWPVGIDLFMSGQVAMTVMGTWAKGVIDADGRLVAGRDYDAISFPSATGVANPFVYWADTFALPIGAPSRSLAVDFLDTLASDEAQVSFGLFDGTIPAHTVSASARARFDPVSLETIQAFETAADRRVSFSAVYRAEFSTPVDQALYDFAYSCEQGACDQTVVIDALRSNYALLQQ